MNAPQISLSEKKAQDQRNLKTIHIPIQAQASNPKCRLNSVNPNFVSAYDQALGVIKDSLNTANPLASLNL